MYKSTYVLGAVILLSYPSKAQAPVDRRLCAQESCHASLNDSVRPSELEVTYAEGMLKITASRCRLGDILEAIRSRTGTNLEIAREAARELVSVEIGPATPLRAIRELLDGDKSNYIIISGTVPGQVERLVMTLRPPSLPTAEPGSAMRGRGSFATAQVRSSEQPSAVNPTMPVTAELPPNYIPSEQYSAPVSLQSIDATNLSSEDTVPQASGAERPPNTPVPGQWPRQIERSLNGVGYQSPTEYVKQFQTGGRQ